MTITAAGAIVYRPSRGFLLLRNRDYWEFPKGRVEASKDEDIHATAVREIREEAGLTDLEFVEGFHEVEQFTVKAGPKDVHMFLALTDQEPTISHEHRGYCWCLPKEVLRFLSYETKRAVFRKAMGQLRAKGLLKEEHELKLGSSLRPQKPRAHPNASPNADGVAPRTPGTGPRRRRGGRGRGGSKERSQ